MPSPPPQGTNSLLKLLNPYASVAQSSYPRRSDSDELGGPPDSPSAVLLRELQLNSGSEERARSPALSPTPTPRRPVHIIATPSSSEDEGPPRSLVFGQAADKGKRRSGSGGRTPKSREPDGQRVLAPPTRPWDAAPSHSPGPFRRRPSSASSSTRSRQSSRQRPESADDSLATPSTESPSPSGAPTVSSSTSGDEAPLRSARTPPLVRATPPTRSPAKVPEAEVAGYAVPTTSTRRTKGRGQHKYHEVSTAEDGRRGAGAEGPSKKAGLSDYNKALWGWVNVVNLDVFLQEVGSWDAPS